MYMDRNKGFSFLEIIITLTISLIISSILFEVVFSMNKSFTKISETLKKDKEIETFKNLLSSHIDYSKSVELRILDIKSNSEVPAFSNIFASNGSKRGSFLILKFKKLNNSKDKIPETNYRTFFFEDEKLKISYYLYGDTGTYGNFSSQTEIVDKCKGNFEMEENLLKIFIETLDKNNKKGKKYEFSLYF